MIYLYQEKPDLHESVDRCWTYAKPTEKSNLENPQLIIIIRLAIDKKESQTKAIIKKKAGLGLWKLMG